MTKGEIFEMILKASPWVKFVHIMIFAMPILLLLVAVWMDKTDSK